MARLHDLNMARKKPVQPHPVLQKQAAEVAARFAAADAARLSAAPSEQLELRARYQKFADEAQSHGEVALAKKYRLLATICELNAAIAVATIKDQGRRRKAATSGTARKGYREPLRTRVQDIMKPYAANGTAFLVFMKFWGEEPIEGLRVRPVGGSYAIDDENDASGKGKGVKAEGTLRNWYSEAGTFHDKRR